MIYVRKPIHTKLLILLFRISKAYANMCYLGSFRWERQEHYDTYIWHMDPSQKTKKKTVQTYIMDAGTQSETRNNQLVRNMSLSVYQPRRPEIVGSTTTTRNKKSTGLSTLKKSRWLLKLKFRSLCVDWFCVMDWFIVTCGLRQRQSGICWKVPGWTDNAKQYNNQPVRATKHQIHNTLHNRGSGE